MRSLLKNTLLFLFLAAATGTPALAIGEFGIGLNAGMTGDPNNISTDIDSYNMAILKYRNDNPGTKTDQINVPLVPVIGFNMRYQFNYILFRVGALYSRAFILPEKGHIDPPALDKNTIRFRTFQFSLPATVALIIPLKRRTMFYMGYGLNFHLVQIRISQSDPNAAIGLPSASARDTFEDYFAGFHLIIGAEIPVTERVTISGEWLHQSGTSDPVQSADTSATRSIDITSDLFLLGLNYYIRF